MDYRRKVLLVRRIFNDKKTIVTMFMILLVGCGRTVYQPTATVESATSTSFAANTLPLLATLTVTPSLTATLDPSKLISGTEPLCIQRQEVPEFTELANTSLILFKTVQGSNNFNLLDFPDLKNEIPWQQEDTNNSEILDPQISPNNQYIIYLECPIGGGHDFYDCSYVLRSQEKEIMRFPMDEQRVHWQLYQWIDNERLMILVDQPADHLIVFNPFTGEQNDMQLALPNVYHYPTKIAAAVMSPSLKYVTYFTKQGIGKLVMWDTDNQKKIAEITYIERPYGLDYFYGWSPDGTIFAAVSPDEGSDSTSEEIFLMESNGNVQQLTHFSDYYKKVSIHTPLWSPDGRFLAFWVQVSDRVDADVDEMRWHLVVFDMKTQEVKNLCIDFSKSDFSPSVERPVWSPDSNHLAIRVIEGNQREKKSLLIVNLLTYTYSRLSISDSPIGWIQGSK